MSTEFLRVQLAPLVLRALREISSPDGLPTVSRLARWAEEADLTRPHLRRAFNQGLELAWRTLLAGYVIRAEEGALGAGGVLSAVLPDELPATPDRATLERLVEGLMGVADDPPRLIPRSEQIHDAAGDVLDLEPVNLPALRTQAATALVDSFAETDAEEVVGLMPAGALLDATVAATLRMLAAEHPLIRTTLQVSAEDLQASFQERLEERKLADGNRGTLQELEVAGERVLRLVREFDARCAPAQACWENEALFELLSRSKPAELAERIRQQASELPHAAPEATSAPTSASGVDTTVTPAATPAKDANDADDGDVVISVAPKRARLRPSISDVDTPQNSSPPAVEVDADEILITGERKASETPREAEPVADEVDLDPDTRVLDALADEDSGDSGVSEAGVVVVGPSTSDTTLLRVDAGPREPKAKDPFDEPASHFEYLRRSDGTPLAPPEREAVLALVEQLSAGSTEWTTSLSAAEPEVVDALREVVLRKPQLADASQAWRPLFVDREAGPYTSAWRARLLAEQRLEEDTLLPALTGAGQATLALLPAIVSSEAFARLLERLLAQTCREAEPPRAPETNGGSPSDLRGGATEENGSHAASAESATSGFATGQGSEAAQQLLERLLALRGAALAETVLEWACRRALPETLWPALARVLAQARRPSVLPPLHATLDNEETPEAIRRQVAALLVTLGDLERVQQFLELLPELAKPEGLLRARALWHGDRALPFARKMAQLPALHWIPEAWYDELARHIPAAVPALPEAEARTLLARADLPEPIREALEVRAEARASHLPPEANLASLVELYRAEPELPLSEAWARVGGSEDVRTLLAMLPAEPGAALREALAEPLAGLVREALDDGLGAIFAQQERVHAGVVDAVEVLALWQVASLLEVVPALLRQTPATRLGRLCRALADYGDAAYPLLKEFLQELAASPEGHLLASRDGIAEALVTALVDTGGAQQACGYLRELLAQWDEAGKLPSALALAIHRHALEDGEAAAVEAALKRLAVTTHGPLIAALAEGITRGRPSEAQPLLDYLAARHPGLDLRPARRVLAAGSVAAEPLRFAMRFTRAPQETELAELERTLGQAPERHVVARLARGLVRLGSESALQLLLEKVSPALAAYALQALAPEHQERLLGKLFTQSWACPEPSKFVRAWLDTSGLDNLLLLAAFAQVEPSHFPEPERLARRLPDLVAAVADPRRLEHWLLAVRAALTNEALPLRLREFALDGLLAGPVREAAQLAQALYRAVRATPLGERHEAEQRVLQRIARWLTLLRTPESEELRLEMLPELEPHAALDVLEMMPDAALQERPSLIRWLMRELPAALTAAQPDAPQVATGAAEAYADKLAAAQGRVLRNVPTERVGEHLWSKDVVERAQTALAALAVGMPTFWRLELEHMQGRQFRSAPVFAQVMESRHLAEGVMLYGLLGLERESTAVPSGVLLAFLEGDAPRWMLTALAWQTRRAIYAELMGLAERNGQAWGLAATCRVLHEGLPHGQFLPPRATRHEVACNNCGHTFLVAFPGTLDTVPATCARCGTRLKLKNVPSSKRLAGDY